MVKKKLNVLDLFSGIGGFTLGLERAGFNTVAFCEIDSYCQKILKKNWNHIPIFPDIKKISKKDFGKIDLICGGFPCQDISLSNIQGKGIEGKNSCLWFEFKRLIQEIKPKWVIIENVANLRIKGLGEIIKNLDEIGYNSEWHIIPAYAVGYPHKRDRIWIVANTFIYKPKLKEPAKRAKTSLKDGFKNSSEITGVLSDTKKKGLEGSSFPEKKKEFPYLADILFGKIKKIERQAEPTICRVVDGVPNWSHRVKSIGNAVIPRIPQIIGEAILEWEQNAL